MLVHFCFKVVSILNSSLYLSFIFCVQVHKNYNLKVDYTIFFVYCKIVGSVDKYDKEVTEQMMNEEILSFLKGMDFLRLGQNIQKQNWQAVMMGLRRMQKSCAELELKEFDRYFIQLRDAAAHRNVNVCKQIMAQIVAKRVQLLKQQSGEEQQSGKEQHEIHEA